MALHEVTNQLSTVDSFDDLCRAAVELGRSRLGFDRLGIWMVGEDRASATGTFGVDEEGRVRDERGSRVQVSPQSLAGQVLASKRPFALREDTSTLDNRAEVLRAIGQFSAAVERLRQMIDREEAAPLEAELDRARRARGRLSRERRA